MRYYDGIRVVLVLYRQVKLAYQESEMVTLLKRIPLGVSEMAIIRERGERLRDGKLMTRGEALLPLTLASFIFDSLCLPSKCLHVQMIEVSPLYIRLVMSAE